MSRKSQVNWTLIILASFGFQLMVLLLEAGYRSTPFGTADSAGNELGFNNPITNELIWIMFSRVRVESLFADFGWYFLLCLLAHLVGLCVVWIAGSRRTRMVFFGLQTILFPLGWLPMFWLGPVLVAQTFFGTFDGETIADGPLNMFFAHVTWWQISLVVTLQSLALADRKREVSVGPAMA